VKAQATFRVLIGLVTICLVAAGCGSDNGGGSGGGGGSGPIKMAFVGSLSGAGAVFADQGLQSLDLAVKEINDAGGISGRQIQVIKADDASDPKTSQQVCTRLVQQDRVDVIIGFQNSADREGCLPEAIRANFTPYLYATPYEGKECAPNFFVDGEVPSQNVAPQVEYLVKEKGAKKVYFIGSDYVAPRGTNEFGRAEFEKLGAQVVGEEYGPLGTTDWTPLISNMMRSGADTFVASAIGADYIALLQQFRDTPGHEKLTLAGFTIPIGAGDAAKGLNFASSYFAEVDSPENQAYKAALQQMFGDKYKTPSILSVPTYDFVHLYKLAVEKAGSTDHQAVNQAMKEVSFNGPGGEVAFNQQGHATLPIHIASLAGDPLAGGETILKSFPPVDPGNNDDGDCSR
jgi:branched-chain amino acid transport system substrate-binding protein